MKIRKWLPVLLPFSIGLLGTQVYSVLPANSELWGHVLASLYYIPIVIAAIVLGARPALCVALAAGCAHSVATALQDTDSWMEPIAQTLLFVCVGLTAARLAKWRADSPGTVFRQQGPIKSIPIALDEPAPAAELPAVKRVVSGLVRHFRTPLTSIEGAGWILDDPKLPDNKRRELVGIVRKEAFRLNRVLTDVVDFMQPRNPSFRTIDLSTLVDDVIQLAGAKEPRRACIVTNNIPVGLPTLAGDPEQIRQVLLNLVTNSIQATPVGGKIEISAGMEDGNFVIAVKDHGTGIPAAAAERIFDPFFTTHEHQLGLGLPLALRIVTDHGGRMTVDCREGEGTCVSVFLPAGRNAARK
jgi:signal transduction histidine kinase